MRLARPPWFAVLAPAVALGLAARPAHADSGLVNLHLEAMFNSVLSGGAMIAATGRGFATGGNAALGLDVQFAPPVAIELKGGAGWLSSLDHPWLVALAGARVRLFDAHQGVQSEASRPLSGHGFVAAHLGYHWFETAQFSADVEAGAAIPITRPLFFESFIRLSYLHAFDVTEVNDLVLQIGVGLGWSFGILHARDTDHDGLSDDEEERVYHTDPDRADTDGDGLSDAVEVRTHSDPNDRDTNHDGVPDGLQDAARDRGHEPEAPRPDAGDGDRDGVPDDRDACLDSPAGTAVDERGCPMQ